MNDLIRREDLENWLRTECYGTDTDDDKEYVIGRLREDLPTVDLWHRAEEPPKEKGAYAVCAIYQGKWYWCKGVYWDGRWLREGDGAEIPVGYWMPIEPPKEDE